MLTIRASLNSPATDMLDFRHRNPTASIALKVRRCDITPPVYQAAQKQSSVAANDQYLLDRNLTHSSNDSPALACFHVLILGDFIVPNDCDIRYRPRKMFVAPNPNRIKTKIMATTKTLKPVDWV